MPFFRDKLLPRLRRRMVNVLNAAGSSGPFGVFGEEIELGHRLDDLARLGQTEPSSFDHPNTKVGADLIGVPGSPGTSAGDLLPTEDQKDALDGATTPSSGNPYATLIDITATNTPDDLKDTVETVATSNVVLSGEQTISGILTSGSRVGVVGQTIPADNGIYTTGAGAWTRTVDFDQDIEVTQGAGFYVATGDFQGSLFLLTTPDPIVVGSTALSWIEVIPVAYASQIEVDAGTLPNKSVSPLTLAGSALSSAVSANTAKVSADGSVITHSDVTSAGSGAIITTAERAVLPSSDEKDALAGTDGTPAAGNPYVTDSDPRNTDARTPTGAAGGDLAGTYPNPTVVAASETVAGKIELATQAEVDTGTDPSRSITPATLAGSTLSSAVSANTAKVSADGSVVTHSDVTSAGSGAIITTAERGFLPSSAEKAALAGTDGSPGAGNPYVTDSDPRNSDARAPNGAAGGDLVGTYPNPTVVAATETVAGKVERATQAEVDAGTDTTRAVTPATLAGTTIAGTDADAIHDNVAGEIVAVTVKATPISADVLLIEDSADSNNKKRITVGSLPGGSGTDADAIHDNVAAEISAVTEKVAPVSADLLLIEDSADSNNKKRVQIGNLPGGGGTDADAIHDNVAAEISAVTEKTAPVDADLILIEDSAASNAKKRVQVGNLPGLVGANVGDAITAYDSTGGQTFTTTQTVINLDATHANDTATFTLASDEITVLSTGRYEISWSSTFNLSSGSRSQAGSWIERNGTEIGGTRSQHYCRLATHGATGGGSIEIDLTVNDVIRLAGVRLSGSGTISTVTDGTRITMRKMS